jgi:hypothetical protein
VEEIWSVSDLRPVNANLVCNNEHNFSKHMKMIQTERKNIQSNLSIMEPAGDTWQENAWIMEYIYHFPVAMNLN